MSANDWLKIQHFHKNIDKILCILQHKFHTQSRPTHCIPSVAINAQSLNFYNLRTTSTPTPFLLKSAYMHTKVYFLLNNNPKQSILLYILDKTRCILQHTFHTLSSMRKLCIPQVASTAYYLTVSPFMTPHPPTRLRKKCIFAYRWPLSTFDSLKIDHWDKSICNITVHTPAYF